MDLGRRRSTGGRGTPTTTTSVVCGSVWESRMKIDEVKGGFKVFNGSDNTEEASHINATIEDTNGSTKTKRASINTNNSNNKNNLSGSTTTPTTTKRKTWKSDTNFEGFERNPIHIARGKITESDNNGINKRSPIQAKRVVRSEEKVTPTGIRKQRVINYDEPSKPSPVVIGSDDVASSCGEDIDVVCQDKVVSSSGNVVATKSDRDDDDRDDRDDDDDDRDDEIRADEEIEVDETKSDEIEEIKETQPEEIKIKATPTTSEVIVISDIDAEKKKVVVSEVKRVTLEKKFENNSVKVSHQKQPKPISLNVKRQSPVIQRSNIHSTCSSKPRSATKFSPSTADSDEYHSFPETHSRLQSFVDLIMWKDISRSVFIFGIGTFSILSSSYTKDLNISFVSVISYLGLVYLAAIFLFRSIVCRGVIDMDNTSYVVGEEESIWLLKLVLPYLNEFLLKLKALFSGDPSTTMKLAVLLFILARCGSSITIWTMAKLGFFGVFTVPKVCSLYSTQITSYAKFWARRFRDAWDTCSHKKGVTVAVFLLVWNLSSILARIWAVFMLFVAFRYYQQNLVTENWYTEGEETWHEPIGVQRQRPESTIIDHTKPKKIT